MSVIEEEAGWSKFPIIRFPRTIIRTRWEKIELGPAKFD